jgi:hypothetical protein
VVAIGLDRYAWSAAAGRGRGGLAGSSRVQRKEIGFAWRVFGSAGFWGWFGLFRSRRLGEFRACATNQRDLVLITKTNGTKMVISPHLPDAFLAAVRKNMGRAA